MTTFLVLIISYVAIAQVDSINQRVFLIGDAGELVGNKQPVIDWISHHVDLNDTKTTFLYLGDNIYPLGLPMEGEPTFEDSKKIIDAQLNLVKDKKSREFFVMGNH